MVGGVIVAVGPLPSDSVLAYTTLARAQLGALAGDPDVVPALGDDLLARFDALHEEWEALARSGPEFVWQRELDSEEAAWVTHGFFRTVERVAARQDLPDDLSEASGPFYRALVTGLLDALEREPGSQSCFACDLRDGWPFL